MHQLIGNSDVEKFTLGEEFIKLNMGMFGNIGNNFFE